ncbi:hypothetical protein [Deinococcus hohokamensis]|uniref:Uncharacterized protein n=1 Tax=Deinococcus hohokamensis TaxID=309883 RepID=A0ABV9ICI0_9DEIO
MKRPLLAFALMSVLGACTPAAGPTQMVQVYEGQARILLLPQPYRLTFTVNPATHELRGTLEQRRTGDRFEVTGTLLDTADGEELTAQVSAGAAPRFNATLLGFGVTGLSLKADALLSGRISHRVLDGHLRVGGVRYALTMRRVQ